MKTMLRSTLYVLLLTIGLIGSISLSLPGCKPADVVEPEPDDVPTLPITNRLVKVVYKSINLQGPVVDKEQIEIGGRQIDISTQKTITYEYDDAGRIVRQNIVNISPYDNRYFYEYLYNTNKRYIYINSCYIDEKTAKKIVSRTDTLQLNDRELAVIQEEGVRVEYDTKGFTIKRTARWYEGLYKTRNNNSIENTYWYGPGIGLNIKYQQFDTTRLNRQPNLFPYKGRANKNLLLNEVLEVKQSSWYPNGLAYRTDYTYTLDNYGRILKEVQHGKPINPAWPFQYHTYGVGVYYYEYQ
jgi:hypothetical protein